VVSYFARLFLSPVFFGFAGFAFAWVAAGFASCPFPDPFDMSFPFPIRTINKLTGCRHPEETP